MHTAAVTPGNVHDAKVMDGLITVDCAVYVDKGYASDEKKDLDVLGKRLARYELTLHPDKTRFVDFRSYRPDGKDHPDADGTTFIFLAVGKVAEG